MDAMSLVMFIIPIVCAIAFTFASIFSETTPDDPSNSTGFICSMIATFCWMITSLTWVGLATMEVFQSIGWLWWGLFLFFSVYTVIRGLGMLGISVRPPKEQLVLRERDEDE